MQEWFFILNNYLDIFSKTKLHRCVSVEFVILLYKTCQISKLYQTLF